MNITPYWILAIFTLHSILCHPELLSYRAPKCDRLSYQQFLQIPLEDFALLSGSSYDKENEQFLGNFNLISGGTLQCAGTANSGTYKLHALNLRTDLSTHVTLDVSEKQVIFIKSQYSTEVSACESGKKVSGLEDLKLAIPRDFSLWNYTLSPESGFVVLDKVNGSLHQFELFPTASCVENSYHLTLTATARDRFGRFETDSVPILIEKSSSRNRRTIDDEVQLIAVEVTENTRFAGSNFVARLEIPPEDTLEYNIILTDDVFEVDEFNGRVVQKVGRTIDREVQDQHVLKFNIRDTVTSELYQLEYRLDVVDVDDTAPMIINEASLTGFIDREPSASEIQILQLTIRDPDITPEMGDRVWDLNLVTTQSLFELTRERISPSSETETVWLQYGGEPGVELSNDRYLVTLTLTDQAGNSREYDITIIVGQPTLQLLPIPDTILVPEDLDKGTPVYRVRVEAAQGSTPDFDFEMLGDGDGDEFTFNRAFGQILTNRVFDVDVKPAIQKIFNFKVDVTDNSGSSVTDTFSIEIVDRNDKAPVFQRPNYQATVPEDKPSTEVILKVSATDADETAPNNEIFYEIDPNVPFTINQATGEIYARDIDYEATSNGQLDSFIVRAKDKGRDNVNEGIATVFIQLVDVNDEAPIFDAETADGQCQYTFSVKQDAPDNFQVGAVSAYDPDRNSLTYSITGSQFRFDDNNMGVILKRAGVSLTQEIYNLVITAVEDVDASSGASNLKTCHVIIQVESENAAFPQFDTCPNGDMALSVLEGSNPGTTVGDLAASDEDFGQSGRVDFVLPPNDFFTIQRVVTSTNPEHAVGRLKTAVVFDRETTDEYCILALVKDGYSEDEDEEAAFSYKQNACRICVEIQDRPDTAPVFFNAGEDGLRVDVSRTNPTGPANFFARLQATDADLSQNEISFSIAGNDNFAVDTDTGNLYNVRSLTGLSGDIQMTATAEDGSSATATVHLIITILQENTRDPPEFTNDDANGAYSIQILETRQPGILDLQIDATTSDAAATCKFNLINGNTRSGNLEREFFDVSQESPLQAGLLLRKGLDFEEIKRFTFQIECVDTLAKYLATQARINVEVVNENDVIPSFVVEDSIFAVYEDASAGTSVGIMQAVDEDPDTELTYSMEPFGSSAGDWFSINSATGAITVTSANRLSTGTWLGLVTCEDDSPSAFGDGVAPNKINTIVTINIWDVNDNIPIVVPAPGTGDQPFRISETMNVGQTIAAFLAEDEDTDPNQRFTFSIALGGGFVPFSINAQGLLKVSSVLDADDPDNDGVYDFNIQVFDQVHFSDPYPVQIIVENVDDEPPVFDMDSSFSVAEEDDSLVGSVVFTINAVNTDAVGGQDAVTYGMSGSGVGSVFHIDPSTGQITLLRALDREAPGEDQFTLFVTARDDSGAASIQELTVTVQDINDHSPYFRITGRYTVDENTAMNTEIGRVVAEDDDLDAVPDEFGTIKQYTLTGGTCGDLFRVESDGTINTNTVTLDREALVDEDMPNAACSMIIEAEDGGGLTGSATVVIVVLDENDNLPEFRDVSPVNAEIDELEEVNTLVWGLYIIDADTPEINAQTPNQNHAELRQVNDHEFFSVDYDYVRSMIAIRNEKPLTFDETSQREALSITVTLKQGLTTIGDMQVLFNLNNWNTKNPVVVRTWPASASISLPEAPFGEDDQLDPDTVIARFTVTDDDTNEGADPQPNAGYRWYIDWSTDPRRRFEIRPDSTSDTASLHQMKPLDKELPSGGSLSLKVCAEDIPQASYEPRRSGCIIVPITTNGIDDTCPIFDSLPQPTVPEAVSAQRQVLSSEDLRAYDFDDAAETEATISVLDMDSSLFEFENNQLYKRAGVVLDRESQEFHDVTFELCDDVNNCCPQTVTVRVTDANDNPQTSGGQSTVAVFYNQEIGGTSEQSDLSEPVFVNDADCCDSKQYSMKSGDSDLFNVQSNGRLSIFGGLAAGEYTVVVDVTDADTPSGPTSVESSYVITATEVTQAMRDNKVTLKLVGCTKDEFVGDASSFARVNYYGRLRSQLAGLLGVDDEDVLVFAIKEHEFNYDRDYAWPYHRPEIDIALSVRSGSSANPWISPDLISLRLYQNRISVSEAVGVEIAEIMVEVCSSHSSRSFPHCFTQAGITNDITVASSRERSLVLLTMTIEPVTNTRYYESESIQPSRVFTSEDAACDPNPCFNGGTCVPQMVSFDETSAKISYTYMCECGSSFSGPRCERMSRSFTGTSSDPSYAIFPPMRFYQQDQHLAFDFIAASPDGLLLYSGPIVDVYTPTTSEFGGEKLDFIALELKSGVLVLSVNVGCDTLVLEIGADLDDGSSHHVDVFMDWHIVTLRIDYCQSMEVDETEFKSYLTRTSCEVKGMVPGCGLELSTMAPVQLGGVIQSSFPGYMPVENTWFRGCISNLVNNDYVVDLQQSSLSRNSVPGCSLSDQHCTSGGSAICRGRHSRCVADANSFLYCDCESGRYGSRCEETVEEHYFNDKSFILYDIDASTSKRARRQIVSNEDADLRLQQTNFKVTFRTTQEESAIMVVRNQLQYQRIQIRVSSGVPIVSFDLGGTLKELRLANGITVTQAKNRGIYVSDGNEHTLSVHRYFNYFLMTLDGGGGYKQASMQGNSFAHFNLHNRHVSVGGWPRYSPQQNTYEVDSNFKGCVSDARINGYSLPIDTEGASTQFGSSLSVLASQNLDVGCERDPCSLLPCIGERSLCLPWFDTRYCTCPIGLIFDLGSGLCVNINECGLAEPVCMNGAECVDHDPLVHPDGLLFTCICPNGFEGISCAVQQREFARASLSLAAWIILILCLIILLLLVCLFIVWKWRKTRGEPLISSAPPYDDQRIGLGFYEGGGECDQENYNIAPLRKPLDDTIYTTDGTIRNDIYGNDLDYIDDPKFQGQLNLAFEPDEDPVVDNPRNGDNLPIEDILAQRLEGADDAVRGRGADCLMVYHFEGEGSEAGSLSTVNTNAPADWQQFSQWDEPLFKSLADMFTDGHSDTE